MAGLLFDVVCLMVVTMAMGTDDMDIRMPNVQPQQKDTYLCFPHKVEQDELYVTGFVPHGSMDTAHHILLYACVVPGVEPKPGASDKEAVWDCGSMSGGEMVCAEGQTIVYAWAMDAPKLMLPKDVGFKVGQNSDKPWLVVQVHYKDVSKFVAPANEKDNSGLTLHTTPERQPKLAGVYLMGTAGYIPMRSMTYMETACTYKGKAVMHPFAFRTHTHKHGKVVSGYVVKDGNGRWNWNLIGRRDPQDPQMFYPVEDTELVVNEGDVLAARCTMENVGDMRVSIGATVNDEMCNFYVMYWVYGEDMLDSHYCFSPGPARWDWSDFEPRPLSPAPEDASCRPNQRQEANTEECFEQALMAPKEVKPPKGGGGAGFLTFGFGNKWRPLIRYGGGR